jgi:hypothetical protein
MSRMSTGKNWLERLWRSAVLNAFPAQRNLQMRTILERDRPTFPELDLPTSLLLRKKESRRRSRRRWRRK